MHPRLLFRFLAASAAILASALVLAACGGGGNKQTTTGATGVTEYVGSVQGLKPGAPPRPGAYAVALTVNSAGRVQGYACDGTGDSQLLLGKTHGDTLDLTSDNGQAILTGTVNTTAVKGKLVVGGKSQQFTASRAQETGGLYTFSSEDGKAVTAESEGGNSFRGTYSPKSRVQSGTLKLANGQERVLRTKLPNAPTALVGYDKYRVVVLNDGAGYGNTAIGAKRVPSSEFAIPSIKWWEESPGHYRE